MNLFGDNFSIYKTKNNLKRCGTGFCITNDLRLIGPKYIEIGNNFSAEDNCKIQAFDKYNNKEIKPKPLIKIRNNVSMQSNCHISCINSIIINDNVLMEDNVFVTDNLHGRTSKEDMMIPPLERTLFSKGAVVIEENVLLGRNACIMPGVTIRKGAIIVANSVVTKDIAAFCVAAGSPAKIIKDLSKI